MAALGVAALALCAGFVLCLAVARLCRARADAVLCLDFAPVALIGFLLVVMLAHAATGGAVLASTAVTADGGLPPGVGLFAMYSPRSRA